MNQSTGTFTPLRQAGVVTEPWLAPRTLPWLLGAIAFCALLLRIVWMWRYGHVIENEGTAYTRLAINLAAGRGYIGVLGGPHTLMPPLYPYLILLLTPIAGNAELAARLISCAAGMALMWPVYVIASRLGGRRAGLIGAVLVATHGVMIGFSAATYGEGLYFFLLFAATALLLQTVERPLMRNAVLTGVVYGLAYLVRPEAIAYVGLAAVFVVFHQFVERRPLVTAVRQSGLLVVACVVVVAPYVAWLSMNSGHLRLEGKSVSNGIVNQRMAEGLSFDAASRGIGEHLEPLGPDLVADQFTLVAKPGESGLGLALKTVFFQPLQRLRHVLYLWGRDPRHGGPLLSMLVLVGVAAALARRDSRLVGALFLCMTLGLLALSLSVRWNEWDRYYYPFTFFAVVWGAVGISTLASAAARWVPRMPGIAAFATMAVLVGVVSGMSLIVRYGSMFNQSHEDWALTLRQAGEWIAKQGPANPKVMAVTAVVPYYANGDLLLLPYVPENEGDRALQFIHVRTPDYVILRREEQHAVPYIGAWLSSGIPDPCATEVKRYMEKPGQELVIYRWKCPATT